MQRYISNELFHFVGRNKSREEQYSILKAILTECKLGTGEKGAISTTISPLEDLSSNEVYTSEMVCFCDIPINDLRVHIDKYSPFGLSFLKKYLLSKGASPIWYISKKSTLNSECRIENARYHDKMYKIFSDFLCKIEDMEEKKPNNNFIKTSLSLCHYFDSYIFPFMKFFDAEKGDLDEDNYYMEREWRLHGKLDFESIGNIWRIVLPRSFTKQFREDFPGYSGQVSYAEIEK